LDGQPISTDVHNQGGITGAPTAKAVIVWHDHLLVAELRFNETPADCLFEKIDFPGNVFFFYHVES
jgi:hypothetical protein